MKRIFAILLALVLSFSAVCLAEADSDLAYVQANGKLIVGITDFAPMDYQDENGEWIGFDADMAKAFAASLGVEVEFIEIDWDNKIMELDNKFIDVVWNGMTLTEDVQAAMECSNAYANNAQVVIVPVEKAEDYLQRALALNIRFNGEASMVTVRTKESIADNLARQGKIGEAKRGYLALELDMEKNFGSECPYVQHLRQKGEAL